jgi:putative Ca2+/H+ antiporter (TMEM165/GDT1 family)
MKKSLLLALPLLLFSLLLSAPARAEGPVHPVKMLHSDASGLSFQLDFDAYRLISDQVAGVACQRVAFGDMESPVRPVLLGAPPEAVVSVTMQPLATEPIALSGPLCSDLEKGAMALAAEENNGVRVLDMGFMRSQRIVRLEIPALHLDPATGQRVFVRQMRVAVAFEEGQAGAYVAEPDSYEAIFKELLVNGEEAKHFRLQPSVIPPETAPWTPPSPAWRILVDAPGMYEISYQALRDAGLPVDSLDPRTLKLYNFGKETPITVTGEADSRLDPTDSLLFYGHGVDTRYTSVNVYWLTYGNGSGSRISDRQSASPATPATSYQAAIESEENFFYVSSLPMNAGIKLFISTFVLLFLAEIGDKTQLATLGLASDKSRSAIIVFLASASALVCTSLIAVLVGHALGEVLPQRLIRWVGGVLFIVMGLLMLGG